MEKIKEALELANKHAYEHFGGEGNRITNLIEDAIEAIREREVGQELYKHITSHEIGKNAILDYRQVTDWPNIRVTVGDFEMTAHIWLDNKAKWRVCRNVKIPNGMAPERKCIIEYEVEGALPLSKLKENTDVALAALQAASSGNEEGP